MSVGCDSACCRRAELLNFLVSRLRIRPLECVVQSCEHDHIRQFLDDECANEETPSNRTDRRLVGRGPGQFNPVELEFSSANSKYHSLAAATSSSLPSTVG